MVRVLISVAVLFSSVGFAQQFSRSSAGPELDKSLSDAKMNLNSGTIKPNIVYTKDGDVYRQIGLRTSDVIKSSNGDDVNSPEAAQKAYAEAAKPGRHKLQIERDGHLQTLKYDVR
jgi:hypothetical protein